MANLPHAKKAIRVTKRRTAKNQGIQARLRQMTRKTLKLVELGEKTLAQQQLQIAQKVIDKAAKTRVIHTNKAKRMKSRLAKKVNSISKDVKTAQKNT
ncbi:30S ribosomal protein S20 [Candidatus Dojkabacteria bacterium]|nr:30S ribosomal protein S20 [Candidatus Dojkabacteria bacterium]